MEETRACLLSYAFDGQGSAAAAELSSITQDDSRFVWIHLNGKHGETKKFLKDQVGLGIPLIKSLLAEETRPRLEELGHDALLILRGINFNPGPEPEDLVSLRLWISKNRIISVGRRKSRALAEMEERIKQNRGPKSAGEFVSMLAMILNEGIEPAIQDLEDAIDRLEDLSLETPTATLRGDLSGIRKQATLFRRHLSPQRDVIARLQKTEQPWMSAADKWYMQDNADRISRIIEDLDAIRERAQIVQDELYNALSARLNKNLYVLSLITVIFMPLTFVTGLLGMNVAGIPGADHPYAFAVVCGIAALIALVQVLLFRRLKWF